MSRFHPSPLLLVMLCCLGCTQAVPDPADAPGDDPSPPLEVRFEPFERGLTSATGPSCGVPEGRPQAYDPKTGSFHIHFRSGDYATSAFEVTKVAERSPGPIVFRLTGVPQAYGCLGTPLSLIVDGKSYAFEKDELAPVRLDKALCRVERKDDTVTLAFTEKGRAILKPGARVSFSIDTGW
jgi:hypothetical protein